ncbi:hypothetical protein ABPG74_009908 [Tetrahymena malaccensis]
MINLNERPAMENYYLLKKLPEYTHIKETGKDILKDSKYYTNMQNENQWNNKYRFSRKYLQFFHDANQTQGLDKRLALQQQEVQKEENIKQQHKTVINFMRKEALDRLHERKMERINVQLDSQQFIYNINEKNLKDLSMQEESAKIKRTLNKSQQGTHYLTGFAPTLWNELNQKSQKYLNQSFNSKIIEKDSQAVENINKRIEKEQQDEELKNSLVKANMEKIRNNFKERSIKNFQMQQKVLSKRTSPLPNPPSRPVLEIIKVRSKSQINPEIVEKQKQEALLKKQYEEFLEQERDYLRKINIQYEADKHKYSQQKPYSTNNDQNNNSFNIIGRQQTMGPQSSQSTSQNIQQNNNKNVLLTFGATVNGSQSSNFNSSSLQSEAFKNKINNIFNNQAHTDIQAPFDVSSSAIMMEKKISGQSPISNFQHQNYQNFNYSMSSLSNELDFQKKFQQNPTVFGNGSISQILEKPMNPNEMKNTGDLLQEISEQKIYKKNSQLKSSLKSRSYSQNTTENQVHGNFSNSMMMENPYNPLNEMSVTEASRSKELKNITESENQMQNDSQLNQTIKKVNFTKEDSFLEYNTAPTHMVEDRPNQNKSQNLINESDLYANQNSFSVNSKNRSIHSASLSATTTTSFPLKYLKSPIVHKQNPHLNDLSQPKSEKWPEKFTDKAEFRGLLSSEIDKIDSKLNNSFVKTMTLQSKIVRDQTLNSIDFRTASQTKKRFSSTSKQPSTTYSDNEQFSNQKPTATTYYYSDAINDPEKQTYIDDLEKFDDSFSINNVRRCFPGKTLNEYRHVVKEFQKIKEKDAQPSNTKKRTMPTISPQKSLNESRLHPSFLSQQKQNSRIIQ